MASPLRKWMRAEDIYDKDLEQILDEFGVKNPPGDFKNITQDQWYIILYILYIKYDNIIYCIKKG